MSEILNAKITKTKLGIEDHGILTFALCLEISGGSGCWYGNVALDNYDKQQNRRIPTSRGFDAVLQIMKVVGVENWEDLKGEYIRVEVNDWGSIVDKIGNLMQDKWFSIKEFFKEEDEEEKESESKENIVTVDYLLDLLTKLHENGNGSMKIKCLDNPLHEDEITVNYTKNEILFRGFIFNFSISDKIRKFCSDIEKAKDEFYRSREG